MILQHIPEITGHKISDAVTIEALLWKDMSLLSFMYCYASLSES